MHTYRNALPLPSGQISHGILDSLRAVAVSAVRHLPGNPILAVAAEMDRLTEALTDEDRRTVTPEVIARRLRSRAYRVAVSGVIGGIGKVGGGA